MRPPGSYYGHCIEGLGGAFQGRLVFKNEGHRERAERMIDDDIEKLWERDELCSSDDSVFIGSGVCEGRTKELKSMVMGPLQFIQK